MATVIETKIRSNAHSLQLHRQAQQYIPGGVNSPVRAFQAVGGSPRYIEKAHGAYIIDADGNQYIDYVGSWGPMIAGHNHPSIKMAVTTALQNGLSFGACCQAEVKLAARICELMPTIEKIRFVSSGTEATMSALRLARAYTKRDKVIKFAGCYHGHGDSFLVQAGSGAMTFGHPSSPGVTAGCAQDTLIAEYNDIESVAKLLQQYPAEIAAIIVEPIAANMNVVLPHNDFLLALRQLCDQHGALLIFDEVITGFRVAKGGAQALFNVAADLTTLGKIIGGGMPVGAFGGRRDIMDCLAPMGPVYQAGTLSGNPIAMSAGLATLNLINQPNFYETLLQKTQHLALGLVNRAKQYNLAFQVNYTTGILGFYFNSQTPVDTFTKVKMSDNKKFNDFFNGMLNQGIYLAPSMYEATFVSTAHTNQDIAKTLAAAEACFAMME